MLYSLKLSSKYYFNVTEECPFSLADMLKSHDLKQVLFTIDVQISKLLAEKASHKRESEVRFASLKYDFNLLASKLEISE